MIQSFADSETRAFWETGKSKKVPPPNLRSGARRKLQMLDAARQLRDLEVPPGNRLHRLHKEREGQYAIRINDQLRVCFFWRDGHAYDVEITDYH